MLGLFLTTSRAPAFANEVWPPGLAAAHDAVKGVFPAETLAGCCWMGTGAVMRFARPLADTVVLRIGIPSYAAAPGGTLVVFRVNDMPGQTRCCYGPGEHDLAFTLGRGVRGSPITVRIRASPEFVPAERGIGPDRRRLTILIRSLRAFDPNDRFQKLDGEGGASPRNLIVVLAGGIAAAIGARKRSAIAWAALLASAPFSFAYAVGGTTLTLPKLILLGAVAGTASRRDVRAAIGDLGAVRWIVVPFVAFLLSMSLSDGVAVAHGAALRETLKAAEYALTFALAFLAYRMEADDVLASRVVAGVASLVALLALAQLAFGAAQWTLIAGHTVPRIAGPLEGPNQLAAFLGLALPVLAVRALARRPSLPELAGFVLASLALVGSISRSGIIAAAFAVVIFLILRREPSALRKTLVVFSFVWVVIAAAAVAGARGVGAFARLFGGNDDAYAGGLGNRVELWRGALALWRAHPWLGVGPGNYEVHIGELIPGVATHANGYYLHVLAEQGLLGACAFLALTGGTIAVLARGIARPLTLGVFAAVLGLTAHQLVDGIFIYPKVGVFAWALIGIAAAKSRDGGRIAEGKTA